MLEVSDFSNSQKYLTTMHQILIYFSQPSGDQQEVAMPPHPACVLVRARALPLPPNTLQAGLLLRYRGKAWLCRGYAAIKPHLINEDVLHHLNKYMLKL